jgi:3-hydroxymyristoyl/3-hydroxydecanoyl-(acyl carrier protein) dehydratase
MQTEWALTISEDHPSLAGHFPGHPVVPAVVMLGEIMHVIRQATGRPIEFVGMPSAKFLSPLKAGEALILTLTQPAEGTMEFTCAVGSRVIVGGSFRYCLVADKIHG